MTRPYLLAFVFATTLLGTAPSAMAYADANDQAAWSYDALKKAYAESGRKLNISQETFGRIQENKKRALATIEKYLTERFGHADPAVISAFKELPREYYHYNYADGRAFASNAYEEEAKPWAIGYGSALSDYLGQAYMTQLVGAKPESVVLEIGTGSGFQSSLLSRIAKKVYSVEIIEPLGKAVSKIYKPLNYTNVETRVGDGYFGWPEVKEGFDVIIVTCAAEYVPPPLLAQLKPGGRMIIPIGQPFKKGQILYVYNKDKNGKVHSRKDVGVFFIPMTGEQQKKKPDAAG